MHILVTGGAGYMGAQLVFRLSKLPGVERVTVFDNLSRGNYNLFISASNRLQSGNVVFAHGDLLDSRKLKRVLRGVDVVYHLAAKVASPYQDVDSHFYEQTNNWGTAELCYAAEEAGVKRFINVSSTSVYGGSKKSKMVSEESDANPRAFYAISKLRGEEHVQRLMDGGKVEALTVRCGNVYGYSPTIRFDAVINKFLFEANFMGRIAIHGSGKQARSFIHIEKAISTLVALRDGAVGPGTYNLTDVNLQVLDIVDVLKEIFPDLEFTFINQHLDLRDLIVDPDTRLSKLVPQGPTDLKSELIELKEKSFAFSTMDALAAQG